ncbi:MAG: hypothetical protein ABIF09_07815 [Gemmatimonadota bacterium]
MSGSGKAAGRNLLRWLRPTVLGLLLVLEGCATGGSSNPFDEATNMDVFTLRVESRNTFDVSVYVNPAGKRQLVGTVSSNGLEFFEFEYPAGRPLNVELETRVGDRYRLPPLVFTGGGRLDLLVSSELRRSGFVRRSPDP